MVHSLNTLTVEIRDEWISHILPFWINMKDDEQGGYYGELDYSLKLDKTAAKGGIANSRILWSFSAAYRYINSQAYADHANHSFRFLKEKLLDPEFGGVYWSVDYQGNPLDTRKHIYSQAFAVYSLSEYYRALHNEEALELAKTLFFLIEEKGYDPEINAYKEEFNRSWEEQPNEMLSENNVIASITMNTHIHILEAYTTLYRVWPDSRVRAALENLLHILHDRMFDAKLGRLHVFFDQHWNSLLDLTSYGHDIEASWLIDDAMQVIGSENPDHKKMIIDLAYSVAKSAIQSDGSLANEREKDHMDTTRIWWVQAEAIVGFYNAYQRTNDPLFMDLVTNIWKYTKDHIIDSRPGSEWVWAVKEDGSHDQREIAGAWKCPYHNSRFCIEIMERMNK